MRFMWFADDEEHRS